MKLRCLLALGLLLPAATEAACIVEPLESQLHSADTVYIGTVVESSLVAQEESLTAAGRLSVMHVVTPQRLLKGDPSDITSVVSMAGYGGPDLRRFPRFSEMVRVAPGDTLLVVGYSGKPSYVTLCGASRHWDTETARAVSSVFPAAP